MDTHVDTDAFMHPRAFLGAASSEDAAGFSRAFLPGEAAPRCGVDDGLPAPSQTRPWRRRVPLLAGAAAVALAAAGLAALAVHSPASPDAAAPVAPPRPGGQTAGAGTAETPGTGGAAGVAAPTPQSPNTAAPLVAPAARTAASARPERGPLYRPETARPARDDLLAEVRSFHGGVSPAGGEAPPAAEVGEVGSTPASAPPRTVPRAPASGRPAAVDPRAAVGTAPEAPPAVAEARAEAEAVAPSPSPPAARQIPAAPQAPADPVAVALELRAAPMSRQEQVEVLGLVTKLGAAVRDLRAETATLRADNKAFAERMDDYDRRLVLSEAQAAVEAAGDQTPGRTARVPAVQPAPAPATSPQTQAGRVQAAAASAGGPRRWKVQAASPGLAMLSELDRSGGEGSQMQVLVGDQVPGYGKVVAIQQSGVSWVVKTTSGEIR